MPDQPASESRFSMSEALSRATILYTDNFRLFFLPALIAILCPVIMTILDNTESDFWQGLWFILLPISFSIQTIALLSLIRMITRRAMNETTEIRAIFLDALADFGKAAATLLLFFLILFSGFILFVIPFFFFLTVYFFGFYIVALESRPVTDAFQGSWNLVIGNLLLVFRAHLLVFGAFMAVSLPIMLGLALMGVEMVYRSIVLHLIIAGAGPLFLTFYYFLFCWLKESLPSAGSIKAHETR